MADPQPQAEIVSANPLMPTSLSFNGIAEAMTDSGRIRRCVYSINNSHGQFVFGLDPNDSMTWGRFLIQHGRETLTGLTIVESPQSGGVLLGKDA